MRIIKNMPSISKNKPSSKPAPRMPRTLRPLAAGRPQFQRGRFQQPQYLRAIKFGKSVATATASEFVHDLAGSADSMPDRLTCEPWLLGAAILAAEEELVIEGHRVGSC